MVFSLSLLRCFIGTKLMYLFYSAQCCSNDICRSMTKFSWRMFTFGKECPFWTMFLRWFTSRNF
uniref:Uncharacterized protein n=1 Tax=Rhizophora mucronata TaxID=61149 RepID=A0A2P2JN83_RHIMU